MTAAVEQLLTAFDQLSDKERWEVRHLIVERVPMTGDLTEDDFGSLAAAAFLELDREEEASRA